VSEHPDRFTTAMRKAGREQKILIDYFRNNRGSTSVAAYSTRARPSLPVSLPISWEEIGSFLPERPFTNGLDLETATRPPPRSLGHLRREPRRPQAGDPEEQAALGRESVPPWWRILNRRRRPPPCPGSVTLVAPPRSSSWRAAAPPPRELSDRLTSYHSECTTGAPCTVVTLTLFSHAATAGNSSQDAVCFQ